ncbi:MAG: hypothetical protein KDI74_18640, partial [Gammaproteobacteria bacterium]|nr:hypothetical protein [Gammaproteobacteria bacterium]
MTNKIKSFLIFCGGFVTAVLFIAIGGYAYFQYTLSMVEEYQSEWTPDFGEQLYKSAAELAAAKTEYEKWVAIGDVALWNVDGGSLVKASEFAHETLRI